MTMTAVSTRRRLETSLSTIGHTGASTRLRPPAASALLLIALAQQTAAYAADPLSNLPFNIAGGTPNFDVRLRYEHVEVDGPLAAPITEDQADAFTARARLGYTTGKWNELDGQLEFEGLTSIGNTEHYNSVENGQSQYPIVADADVNEVNQAWVRYSGLPKTQIKYGRQRIVLDNQRFVGNVGWRQNEMTYDAALLTSTFIPKTTFTYAYLNNVNSFKSFNFAPAGQPAEIDDNLDIKAHLVNAQVAVLDKKLVVTAYGYLLDFDEIPPGVPAARLLADSKTFGARITGAIAVQAFTLGYALEYADQQDYEDSTDVVDADYSLVEASLGYGIFKGAVGYEVLEGDGTTYSFQTPLSTAHAHEGWADQFLITPVGGLERTYVSASATLAKKVGLTAVYHQFESESGGLDYGDEIDLLASYAVMENLVLYAKYANYSADEFPTAGTPAQSVDTEKMWVYVEYKF
ncbi:MAG: alginate export family protein [Panacagrimonas sp.]